MKKLLFIFLLTANGGISFAQGVPAYEVDTSGGIFNYIFPNSTPLDLGENWAQCIYHKADFPAMPAQGYITDVFFKLGYPTLAGAQLSGLKLRMGITTMNKYPNPHDPGIAANWNAFSDSLLVEMDTLLTTVYYDSIFTLSTNVFANQWLRLHLPQPFPYSMLPLNNDVQQNLVVQLSQKDCYQNAPTGLFDIITGRYQDTSNLRYINATVGPITIGYTFGSPQVGNWNFLIGFNGYALSVDDPDKIERFNVFPNPAENTLHLSEAIKGRYTVYDISGKVMLSGKAATNGAIDISNLPPGVYVLRTAESTYKFTKR